jgi:hypothetical protein
MGHRGKALPMLTLLPVSYVLLSQAFLSWSGESVPGRTGAAAVITFLFLISIGMMLRIASAGMVFAGPSASPMEKGETKSQTTGKPPAQSNTGRRA